MKGFTRYLGLALLAGLLLAGPIVATISLATAQEVVVAGAGETEAMPVDVGAGEATEVVAEPSLVAPWWQALWADLKGPIFTIVLPGIAIFFARRFFGERGAQIAQEMLASATYRSAGGVMNTLGDAVITGVLTTDNPVVQNEVRKLKAKMAETIARTGATDQALAENIVNSVGQLTAGDLKPVSGIVRRT